MVNVVITVHYFSYGVQSVGYPFIRPALVSEIRLFDCTDCLSLIFVLKVLIWITYNREPGCPVTLGSREFVMFIQQHCTRLLCMMGFLCYTIVTDGNPKFQYEGQTFQCLILSLVCSGIA